MLQGGGPAFLCVQSQVHIERLLAHIDGQGGRGSHHALTCANKAISPQPPSFQANKLFVDLCVCCSGCDMVCSSPSQFRTALAALVLVQIVLPATCLSQRRSSENHWVDIWGAMPQLVEYTNMPPVPFVRVFLFLFSFLKRSVLL